ncbi:MAG: hypothetical protein H7Z40_18015 [Phycisphaerae bacterium]|nr:hypothetical protein [Gemmatimonadaceae bacterium]
MSAPFVTTLGVRPEAIRLVDGTSPVTPRDSLITLRVRGAEVWDAVRVEASASTPVRNVKQAALAVLMPDVDTPDLFVVKMQGRELRNENLSLSDAGVSNGATLLVMSRRRHAVR